MLHQLIHDICELYIDDVNIQGRVLGKSSKSAAAPTRIWYHASSDKAKVGLTQLEYLGHFITQKWMGMSDAKINKVLNFPMPKKGKQLKQFLGLGNCFREHIQISLLLPIQWRQSNNTPTGTKCAHLPVEQ